MARFTPQPDEGYSEDPLTALSASTSNSLKPREDAVTPLGSARLTDEFPAWLVQHVSSLSLSRKTELAMALLSDLPTAVVSQIVEQLKPRLYIDFVRYLPPEVCLKILGYLDPVSLINVARACRAWYDLALDRKLWEQLYYLEGWKAIPTEIEAAERDINKASPLAYGALRRDQSQDDGLAHKKRAIAVSPTLDADMDMVMLDIESSIKEEPVEMDASETSIFGGPRIPPRRTGISQKMGDLHMQSAGSGSSYTGVDKGKGRALSPSPPSSVHIKEEFPRTVLASPRLPRSTLWVWDEPSRMFKINWKYLYTMRRRLESNWERGSYTNFQLPHPDHPEEGHGECIYSLQYNSEYLVSGSRDRTLKVWDLKTRRCLRTLAKHRGSVLCLQFDSDPDEDLIVSGSSDSNVVIWRFSTGKEIQTLKHAHRESVLNVKFDKRILVTCSKDRTIKIFNRKPLRHGDLGYREVDPVPKVLKDYGNSIPMSPGDFPEMPAWTMIGSLEGHGAAVNAVQIQDREVVSASGDRHIKVWDWPTQACSRTIAGHTKGIACVQYDGRRIVSGSSDNEVKIFDRHTGLEVANLRSHSSLVRTVQAGFGDLPYSAEEDLAEAKKVDEEYFKAVESGLIDETERPRPGHRRQGNAGSKRPQDICAYGAKLPPGGGGGKYARIVSGSYDTTIIIWRRDKEGIWKDQHHLKQDEAAVVAMRQGRNQGLMPLYPPVQSAVSRDAATVGAPGGAEPPMATPFPAGPTRLPTAGPTLPPLSTLTAQLSQEEPPRTSVLPPAASLAIFQVIDNALEGGQQAFARAIGAHPAILTHRSYVESCIDRLPNLVMRSQLRQTFSAALIRAQFEQARQRREALRNQDAIASGSSAAAATQDPSQQWTAEPAPAAGTSNPRAGTSAQPASQLTAAQLAAAAAHQAHAHVPHEANLHQLQYDARRIICCSQRSVIVGWDFCNGDAELEEASRFFAPVD